MNQNKKILLISVSAGAGHVRAAEALQKTAEQKFSSLEVGHIDMMDYVKTPLKKAVVQSYDIMAKQLPELWGFFYKKTNKPQVAKYARELNRIANKINASRFFEYVEKFNADEIICTHFLPAISLTPAPIKYDIKASVSMLMTDYDNHGLQISPDISRYFVSSEKMRWKLLYSGIEKEKVIISGIPIDPVFNEQKNIEGLKQKYNCPIGQKTILVLSGGQGLISIDKIISVLFKIKEKANIIAIAGNNTKLTQKLEDIKAPEHINFDIIGWTDKIDEYMRIADVVITKPGGLSTTECIALQKPIIAISPIPGQEEHNAEYLLENQLGVIARAPEELLYYLEKDLNKLATGINKTAKKQPLPEGQMSPPSHAAEVILKKISD